MASGSRVARMGVAPEDTQRVAPGRVGAFTAVCLLVSNAVGSGIFTTTGFLARDLGDARLVLALWVVGGLLALAGALSYSELGAALPRAGGEYVYLRRAYGPLAGFLAGWTSFTMGFGAATAAAAVGFAAYMAELVPGAARAPTLLAIALVWGLTAFHARGVERGGSLQRTLTALKIGGIVALVVAAFAWGEGTFEHLAHAPADVAPSPGSLLVGLVFVLYAYSGWNAVGYVAAEIHDPGRSLPRATITGTLVVAVLYLALNLVYFYALPVAELAREPVLPITRKAASALFGASASRAVVALLCASIAGCASAMIWVGPRVLQAMARDGAAPAWLARGAASGAPARAILVQSGWITLLLLSGSFETLVVYGGVALALGSALGVSAVIVLRAREPDLLRPYRVPLYPWVPLAYIAASLLVFACALLERPLEACLALATVATGVPLYHLWRKT